MRRSLLVGIWIAGVALHAIAVSNPDGAAKLAECSKRSKPTDRHGDPLPEGAMVRWGPIRLRHQGQVARLAFLANVLFLGSLGDINVFYL